MRLRPNVFAAAAPALAILFAGACASMTAKEQWVGRPIAAAIEKLGTPSNVIPAEDGSKTYVWLLHRSVPTQTVSFDAQGNPVYGTVYRDSVRTWTFAVDAAGTIVTWNDSSTRPPM